MSQQGYLFGATGRPFSHEGYRNSQANGVQSALQTVQGLGQISRGPYTPQQLSDAGNAAQSILGIPVRRSYDQGTLANWSEANHYVTRQHFRISSKRFPGEEFQHEMLCMIATDSNAGFKMGVQSEYEIPSIYAFNKYLASPEGRRKYGNYTTADVILKDFTLLGAQKGGNTEYKPTDFSNTCVAYVVGKRIRTPDITRAYYNKKTTSGGNGGPDNLSAVYLLLRRCNYMQDLQNRGDPFASMNTVADLHYWRLTMFVSPLGRRPDPCLYSDDTYVGAYFYVGFISDNIGDTRQMNAHMHRMSKEVMDPLSTSDMSRILPSIPPVELMLFL